jgi:hypothetical protein
MKSKRKTRAELVLELVEVRSANERLHAAMEQQSASTGRQLADKDLQIVNAAIAQQESLVLGGFVETMRGCILPPETIVAGAVLRNGAITMLHLTVGQLKALAGVIENKTKGGPK